MTASRTLLADAHDTESRATE